VKRFLILSILLALGSTRALAEEVVRQLTLKEP